MKPLPLPRPPCLPGEGERGGREGEGRGEEGMGRGGKGRERDVVTVTVFRGGGGVPTGLKTVTCHAVC